MKRKPTDKRRIRDIVYTILQNNERARNDDRYLYLMVVNKLNPTVMTRPFYLAYMDELMPSTESVRRARQWCQAHFEELKADDTVAALRSIQEEDYKEFAIHG